MLNNKRCTDFNSLVKISFVDIVYFFKEMLNITIIRNNNKNF